jgi:hypothetical protein
MRSGAQATSRRIRSSALLLTLTLCAGRALGQPAADQPGPWQISALGGYYGGSTPYLFRGDFHDLVEFGSSAMFGLRLGYDFGSEWGLEFSWMQAKPDETFENHVPSFIRQLTLNTYDLDGNLYLLHGAIRPYVTIGFGGANTGSSFGGANLSISGGVGAKWFVNRHIGLRAEWRYRGTYGNVGTPAMPAAYCEPAGCYFYNGSWYYNYEFSGGLMWAF